MPVFEYHALNQSGQKQTGIIDADSVLAARSKLRQQHVFPVSICEIATESVSAKGHHSPTFSLSFTRIGKGEIALTTRQLATLISAGFPLVTALSTLIPQADSKGMQRMLSGIKSTVEEGNSFSEALSHYPAVFSPVYINMITAGESSGTLDLVLERLADMTERQEEMRKRIQAALAYPLFMCIIGTAILFFLIIYIVPGVIDIFTDMHQMLPLPTRLLISLSDFFQSFWWAVLLVPALFWTPLHLIRKTSRGRLATDRLLLRLPQAGTLIKKSASAKFSRILSALLTNGVPMLTALQIAQSTSSNHAIQKKIAASADAVEQGDSLGNALEGSMEIPSLAVQMIKVGEESGQLEKMLEKSAGLFEKETESTITALTSLLEPAIILIMGVVVGFIVLSICLPIFEMNQLAR